MCAARERNGGFTARRSVLYYCMRPAVACMRVSQRRGPFATPPRDCPDVLDSICNHAIMMTIKSQSCNHDYDVIAIKQSAASGHVAVRKWSRSCNR